MAEQTATDIKTPVRYDDQSNGMIFDAEGHHLIDIRGWGYLTGVGGLNLPDDVAIRIQDERCDWIVNAINQHATLLTENAELKKKMEEADKKIRQLRANQPRARQFCMDIECMDDTPHYEH